VYSACSKYRKSIRGDKTEIQHLVAELEKHKYVYFTGTNCEDTTLEDILFSHPESINFLNTFPTVFIMDSTYKTNLR